MSETCRFPVKHQKGMYVVVFLLVVSLTLLFVIINTYNTNHNTVQVFKVAELVSKDSNNITKQASLSLKFSGRLAPKFSGRLGNLLFEYASVYGLATSKNMSVFVSESHLLNRLFSLDMGRVTHESCGSWLTISINCCDYDPNLEHRIHGNKCTVVGDYLQSWKFFRNVSANIQRQFTFNPVIAKSAQEKLLFVKSVYKHVNSSRLSNTSTHPSINGTYQLKETNTTSIGKHAGRGDFPTQSSPNLTHITPPLDTNVTFIGIHVRRGDIASENGRREGRIIPPVEYFTRAMDYFRKRYSNPLFVAASDSPEWLQKNLKRPDVTIMSGNAPEIDMCILSMCNHTIISVGSFGWWVGFLNKGTTIYYGVHPSPKTAMGRYFKHFEEDYIYPGWIGMK